MIDGEIVMEDGGAADIANVDTGSFDLSSSVLTSCNVVDHRLRLSVKIKVTGAGTEEVEQPGIRRTENTPEVDEWFEEKWR